MMRCRAAWQAVVGANVTRISLTDFPMAARAVDLLHGRATAGARVAEWARREQEALAMVGLWIVAP